MGVLILFALAPACVPAQPGNPSVPHAVCEPRCVREHDCDPSIDVPECVARCTSHLGPRALYMRDDYVVAVRTCAQNQACVRNVDASISSCVMDARRRFEPSEAARAFCRRHVEKRTTCRFEPQSEERCLLDYKVYSDPILTELNRCADESPCKWYGRCHVAVLGEDVVYDDVERGKLARDRPVRIEPATTVDFSGTVRIDGQTPVQGASVCLLGPSAPCVRTDGSGAFTLPLPAEQELSITFSAPGFGSRLLPLAVVGTGFIDWKLSVTPDPTLQARYAALGTKPPGSDSAFGALSVTASGPPGSTTGFKGAAMSITPAIRGGAPLLQFQRHARHAAEDDIHVQLCVVRESDTRSRRVHGFVRGVALGQAQHPAGTHRRRIRDAHHGGLPRVVVRGSGDPIGAARNCARRRPPMPHPPRFRRPVLLGALASVLLVGLLGLAAACGPSLRSLARDTFFHSYDCAKGEVEVTGGGGNVPYQATGCGKHASYLCHSENGSMGCEEVGGPPPSATAGAPPASAAAAPSASSPAQR